MCEVKKKWFSNKLFDDKFCQMEIYFLQLFRQPRTDDKHIHTHARTNINDIYYIDTHRQISK